MSEIKPNCPICQSSDLITAEDFYLIPGWAPTEIGDKGIQTGKGIQAKATMCKNCNYLMFFKDDT